MKEEIDKIINEYCDCDLSEHVPHKRRNCRYLAQRIADTIETIIKEVRTPGGSIRLSALNKLRGTN